MKEYIKYVSLNVLGTLGMSLYIFADTLFISRGIGVNGLASLNVVIPAYTLINAISIMLAVGGSVCFSRSRKLKKEIFTLTMLLGAFISFFMVLIGASFSSYFVRILGANSEIFDITNVYFRVIYIFSPFFIFSSILNFFVKNDSNPKLAMQAMLVGTLFNIVLDYILIFPFKLGMFGAVMATCASPLISIIILYKHCYKSKNLKFSRRIAYLKPHFILFTGFPMFLSELSGGFVILVFNLIIFKLKANVGIAAYGIVTNLGIIVTAIYNGIAQGVQPLLTKYYAVKKYDTVKKISKYTNILLIVLSVTIYAFLVLFRKNIILMFNPERSKALQELATEALILYFTSILFSGLNIFGQIKLLCTKQVKFARLISILRGIIVIFPFTEILKILFKITGVWLTIPVVELVTCLVLFSIMTDFCKE